MNQTSHYDVVIIGGGATGAGTARDCALRGLRVLLVERFDLSNGATGRNHGLLHSGARYAVTDQESAAECIRENMTLRRIAKHCVEDTQGLFISLPEDDPDYQPRFVAACRAAGIPAEVIDPKQALQMEPSVNPRLVGAVQVPDGAVDPFRLTWANILDAQRHGATVLTYHEVTALIQTSGRVQGVRLRNTRGGHEREVYADVVVNATGIWGSDVARMADVNVNMFPAKGALLVFGHRVNRMVINRCRKPGDGDILVPGDTVCILGTTSERVPMETVNRTVVRDEEVEILLREGGALAPSLLNTRILRAYSGVRPLVASDDDASGRSISRGIVCLDHAKRDGLEGFVTITGGKLMTYRLMAEWATDTVCRKLNVARRCETAERPLPGSEQATNHHTKDEPHRLLTALAAEGRHGTQSAAIDLATPEKRALVCECEHVSAGEVEYAVRHLEVQNLVDLRRRTRVGMGTCQASLCAFRAACVFGRIKGSHDMKQQLAQLLAERWKGVKPVCWGENLAELQMMQNIYQGLMGLDRSPASQKNNLNSNEF